MKLFSRRQFSVNRAFLLLLTLIFIFLFMGCKEEEPQRRPEIPTKILPDGSKEHVLINNGEDRIQGTEDDQYWVLHIPAEIWSKSLADIKREGGIFGIGEKFIFNRNMTLELPFSVSQDGLVDLDVTSENIATLGLISEWRPFRSTGLRYRSDYAGLFRSNVTHQCTKEDEIAEGVFRLADYSDVEWELYLQGLSADERVSKVRPACRRNSGDWVGYAIFVDGREAAFGSCSPYRDSTMCRLTTFVKPSRVATLKFDAQFLPQFEGIYGMVQAFLDVSLVEAQSKNLNYPQQGN